MRSQRELIFLLVLETKTFLSAFKSGLDELDMDVHALTKRTFGSLSAANLASRTAVFPGIWMCVSGLIVIDLPGAVALVLLEFCV